MSCACQVINYTLATEENVGNIPVCAIVAITFQLLEMSSITTPNQTISNIRTGYKFSRENISDFTDLHNEKNQIWKFSVNGIVFGYWNSCKRLPIS